MLQEELNKHMAAVRDLQVLFKKPLHQLSSKVSSKPQSLTPDASNIKTAKSASAVPITNY